MKVNIYRYPQNPSLADDVAIYLITLTDKEFLRQLKIPNLIFVKSIDTDETKLTTGFFVKQDINDDGFFKHFGFTFAYGELSV